MTADRPEQVSPDQWDAMDRAALGSAYGDIAMGSVTSLFGDDQRLARGQAAIAAIQERAAKKAELADATGAGTHMRVDPAEVDGLARFFEDEAEGLEERAFDVQELANVAPPGTDPTSKGVAEIFSEVGAGDEQAYYENYMRLARVFRDTAVNLRTSAEQTRTDEENAGDSFRGGNFA